ncbi:protein of unknown function [Amycolatopsis xylanica]|uniref:DUF5134 domain-containing protein n=1 Tax=Amycolatopsis xylanica TaxID=589385 RepID=A0A1H3IM78_9PSEU|nr:DUF5134 domain-containing protein [Amycolatopsis xylanica]SDY28792.1 protein of unknown function [Amycolatopsis xylanica]
MAWILTAVFLAITWPCVRRLASLDYARLGHATRQGDVAELLFTVAMVAMLSPIGGPIPAAGWQALFLLASGWFLVAWLRGAHGCAHHAISAVVMLYLLVAMPHVTAEHGPWLNMSTMDTSPGVLFTVVAIAAAVYFAGDALKSGLFLLKAADRPAGTVSRAACRTVMGIGMGYMLLAAL